MASPPARFLPFVPMTTTAGYTFTRHDPRQDTDNEIAERVAFSNELTHELLPDDPDQSVEQAIAALRNAPPRLRFVTYRVRDEQGALVASASTRIDPDDDNPDVLWVAFLVAARHRRRGIGRRLLAELAEFAAAEGKTRLVGSTWDTVPAGPAFAAEAAGAVARQAGHLNHLPLAEVDRPMLERWVAEAATRAADYELVAWDGPVPEKHLADWVELVLVMNTAPLDDLELNDATLTPEQVRDNERRDEAMGLQPWTLSPATARPASGPASTTSPGTRHSPPTCTSAPPASSPPIAATPSASGSRRR